MTEPVRGIHHITCIAGPPQENLDFYAGVLGLRLVKRSVNQDDPGTYHLFYADAEGQPGTDLTFFPWTQMAPRRKGVGLAVEVALAVPEGSLAYWAERLERYGATPGPAETRFGQKALPFADPHGLELALVEVRERSFIAWDESPVPPQQQIRGLHCARLLERELAPTERLLTEVLGFRAVGEDNGWRRYGVGSADGDGGSGRIVEVRALPDAGRGAWGVGSVHHIAWRVADDAHELAMRERVSEAGRRPTPVIDRFWFRSVYFTEPGGVLFELATEGPGFAVDEDPAHLGEALVLPPWLERRRREIEAALPPLTTPAPAEAAAER